MKPLSALCVAALLGACQSSAQREPWMPSEAETEVVTPLEASEEARATIHEENADAVFDELTADSSEPGDG